MSTPSTSASPRPNAATVAPAVAVAPASAAADGALADSATAKGTTTGAAVDAPSADVAALLAELRAGVLQRQAERTALGAYHRPPEPGVVAPAPQLGMPLVELRSREFVPEPVAFSPRKGLGRFLVLLRRVFFKLFMKWYLHPLLQGQNAFNQSASRLLQQLAAEQERLRAELEALRQSPGGRR